MKLFAEVGEIGVQVCTGVGPVTIGPGQVIVIQLGDVGAVGVQDADGTSVTTS